MKSEGFMEQLNAMSCLLHGFTSARPVTDAAHQSHTALFSWIFSLSSWVLVSGVIRVLEKQLLLVPLSQGRVEDPFQTLSIHHATNKSFTSGEKVQTAASLHGQSVALERR